MPVNAQAAAVEAVHEACRKTVLAPCGATVPGVSPEAAALVAALKREAKVDSEVLFHIIRDSGVDAVAEAYELLCRARRVAGAGPAARQQ